MKRWPTKPLGELILEMETGSRPRGGAGDIRDGIPSVSGEHINRDGGFYWDTMRFITRDFYAGMKRGRIQHGDILVVKDGATTGKTATVRDSFPFSEATVNEHIFLLRTDRAKAAPEFVGYFLFGPIGQQQILSNFRGAAIGGISRDFVCNVRVPLPPLAEQERIVKLLDEADELRKLRAQADRRTADLIPALFHEMFGDPATNPRGWPVATLGGIGGGGQYGLNAAAMPEGDGVRFIRITDIDGHGQLGRCEPAFVPAATPGLSDYELSDGDILIARSGATAGKTYLHFPLEERSVFAGYLIRFKIDRARALPIFVFSFLQSAAYWSQLNSLKRAVAQPNVNARQLASLRLPLPPLPRQEEFARRVAEIRTLEAAQAASRTRLEALFQSMLHRAFEGQL